MEFNPSITPVDVIKKGALGGTCFRDIYSRVNDKWYKNSWKEFEELENIDKKYYSSDFYDVRLNYYRVEVGTSLRFWENKGWINEIEPYGWFQGILDIGKEEEVKMIKDKLIDGKELLIDLLVFKII